MAVSDTHFDAVVVGSGFGGSVLAYRLADAGKSVCVLERGKPYPPGSFPRGPRELAKAFWDPSEGLYGMFNVWSFKGIGALVSSGLGGGSLIYANVLLRKPERWFVQEDLAHGGYEHWPVSRADLDPHYDRAEAMLNGQRYPFADTTLKTAAFRDVGQKLGREFILPKLAVTFANDGEAPAVGVPIKEEHPNLHGEPRYTCRLVGECDIGCNFGSKNTLDYNYLSAAKRHGAEIWTRREVRSFAPREGGGYVVRYVEHDVADEGRKIDTRDPHVRPERELTCDRLVLSAGTLGSTYLLLKCRDAFPGLSPRLGTRFGGNGDLLTFALGADRPLEPSRGPVITSALHVPDELDGGKGRGLYVEDAGFPEFVTWLVQAHAGRAGALALPAGRGAARLRAASAQARGRSLRGGLVASLGHPGRRRLAPAPGHGAGHPRREHGPHRRRQAAGRLGEGQVRAVLRRAGRLRQGDRGGARRQVRAQSRPGISAA